MNSQVMDHSSDKPHVSDDAKLATQPNAPEDIENYDFHLSGDSPASGNGVDGVDMGIYGGNAPYIDGGFPSLPAIIDLNSDILTDPSNSLNIEFKAKGN